MSSLTLGVWRNLVAGKIARKTILTGTSAISSRSMSKGFGDDPCAFLAHILEVVQQKRLVDGRELESSKVIDFKHPEELDKVLNLDLGNHEGLGDEEMKSICNKVVDYSVKTNHPFFSNQLYHGIDPYALGARWLGSALNTNGHTFEVAPVFILMERAVLRYVRSKVFGTPEGDGIFAAGGSMSNMYAVMLARHNLDASLKQKGLYGSRPLVLFTSDESHYSILKAANWLGMGMDNVVSVATDNLGRMRGAALKDAVEQVLAEDKLPFFVNATAGSTVMGAFDPLDELVDVCRTHNLWLHVDACWGGTPGLFDDRVDWLRGSRHVDSLAWNPHKMLGATITSSVFVVRHKDVLQACNRANASYLFQQDKFYDTSFDTGDKSVQCGRQIDALNVWFMLKTRGENFIRASVKNTLDAAEHLRKLIKNTDGFEPIFENVTGSGTNVCFFFVPRSLRELDSNSEEYRQRLNKVGPSIKERLVKKGSLMIGYQPLKHKNVVNCFRMVTHCWPPPSKEDMKYVVEQIQKEGEDL